MHLFRRYKPSVLLAQLTHWVLLYIGVPYPFPHTTVASACFWISVVLLVPLCFCLCVFLTEPSVGKPRTAGMGTGSLRFAWHCYPPSAVIAGACSAGYTKSAPYRRPYDSPHTSPPFGHRKSPYEIARRGSPYLLGDYNDIIGGGCLSMSFSVLFMLHTEFCKHSAPAGGVCAGNVIHSPYKQQSAPKS